MYVSSPEYTRPELAGIASNQHHHLFLDRTQFFFALPETSKPLEKHLGLHCHRLDHSQLLKNLIITTTR
jgi:hypothetical protein